MNPTNTEVSLQSTTEPTTVLPSLAETDAISQGVFTLTAEETQSSERSGASAARWDADDHDAELPMIVWLRGDEPWYPQFDLDADSVMERLNIKRSRLTQICGKDLRVGRVRVDRYIRPVFRSKDVDAYLQWTRATASHQKSSAAIKDAVDALQHQSAEIAKIVADASHEFLHSLKQGFLAELEASSVKAVHELAISTDYLRDTLVTKQNIQTAHLENLVGQQNTAFDHLKSSVLSQLTILELRLDHFDATTEALTLRLAEMNDRFAKVNEQQTQIHTLLEQHLLRVDLQEKILMSLGNRGDSFQKKRCSPHQKQAQTSEKQAMKRPPRPTRRRSPQS